jgi:predicted transglutaminase-like cysteine proteinase
MREEILHPASAQTASQTAAGGRGLRLSALAALAAIAGFLALAVPAEAQQAPRSMALGPVTAPPPGYLDFCARMPAECGLSAVDSLGQPMSGAALRDKLYHQYFWASAFGPGAAAHAAPPPAAGDAHARRAVEGRPTDWSAIFGRGVVAAPATPVATSIAAPAAADDAPLATTAAVMAELDRVNLRVNDAIRYVPERILDGDQDYWRLAIGPDGKGQGDCKDYVLEKHKALIAAGVPASDLSIAIVSTTWGETHAILLVRTDRGELVMDSLSRWIQPWTKVRYKWIKRQAPGQQLTWVSLG